MLEQVDFQCFLSGFSRQGLNDTANGDYMEKANEGVANLIKNFDVARSSCAFEFAWNKSSLLVRSAVLAVAKQDYRHLFKQTRVDEAAENFDEQQVGS